MDDKLRDLLAMSEVVPAHISVWPRVMHLHVLSICLLMPELKRRAAARMNYCENPGSQPYVHSVTVRAALWTATKAAG